jgi:hypothetical protein
MPIVPVAAGGALGHQPPARPLAGAVLHLHRLDLGRRRSQGCRCRTRDGGRGPAQRSPVTPRGTTHVPPGGQTGGCRRGGRRGSGAGHRDGCGPCGPCDAAGPAQPAARPVLGARDVGRGGVTAPSRSRGNRHRRRRTGRGRQTRVPSSHSTRSSSGFRRCRHRHRLGLGLGSGSGSGSGLALVGVRLAVVVLVAARRPLTRLLRRLGRLDRSRRSHEAGRHHAPAGGRAGTPAADPSSHDHTADHSTARDHTTDVGAHHTASDPEHRPTDDRAAGHGSAALPAAGWRRSAQLRLRHPRSILRGLF